ncbi:MAG: hypothetical protein ACK55I_13815, partial [bacterium]
WLIGVKVLPTTPNLPVLVLRSGGQRFPKDFRGKSLPLFRGLCWKRGSSKSLKTSICVCIFSSRAFHPGCVVVMTVWGMTVKS